jgi:hypothetical protein
MAGFEFETGSGQKPVAGSCQNGNERFGPTKHGKFIA